MRHCTLKHAIKHCMRDFNLEPTSSRAMKSRQSWTSRYVIRQTYWSLASISILFTYLVYGVRSIPWRRLLPVAFLESIDLLTTTKFHLAVTSTGSVQHKRRIHETLG